MTFEGKPPEEIILHQRDLINVLEKRNRELYLENIKLEAERNGLVRDVLKLGRQILELQGKKGKP